MIPLRRASLAAAAVAAGLVACGPSGSPASAPSRVVLYQPEPSTGPFVVVAVDNHFHDIHPVDNTRLAEDRMFLVKNEGRNLHNFSVVDTTVDVDIMPGGRLVWVRLGDHLPPGTYRVFCKYHAYAGMTGGFVVTP